MPRSSTLCCDANIVVRAVTRATDPNVRSILERWREENRSLVAPTLLRFEVANALHRLRLAGELSPASAARALQNALAFPIEYHADDDLHARAMDMATRVKRPAAYDAHYLALAERLGIELWTADERLYNAVHHQLPWVRFVTL